MLTRLAFAIVPLVALGSAARTPAADAKNPTYDADILPVLRQHCLACHSADKQKGGLDLSTYTALKAGGSSGEVLVPGDPDKSRVYSLTAHAEEPKMPPKANRIPDSQLALLKLWIEQGGRENAGSKVLVAKPKVDLGVTLSAKGRPDGPPPMPIVGKLRPDPVLVTRRPNAVIALATSPWAPLVAIGGPRQVLLYHTDTGTLLGVLPFEQGQIHSLKFSRNGKLLLAAGGRGGGSGAAVLYEVETGRVITEVGSAETDAILAADLSADGSLIAVGTPTRMVRIYRTDTGEVAFAIKKHTDWVTAVEFSPDGVLLATGDRNGGVFVWESATGREFYTLAGNPSTVTDMTWRPDSNVLAISAESGHVRLWEMENGSPVKNWVAHPGGALSVRYAADGKLVTTGRDRLVKVWDGNGTQLKKSEPLTDIGLRVAVTADGMTAIAGDWAGRVTSWGMTDGKPGRTFDANPPPLSSRIQQAEQAVATAEEKLQQARADLAKAKAQLVRANWAAASAAAGNGVKYYIDKIAGNAKSAANAVPQAQAAYQAAEAEWTAAKSRLAQLKDMLTATAGK